MSPKTVYVVIQEGGSSTDAYASSYDTLADAEDAREGHTRATYRSSEPMSMEIVEINGKTYVEEAEVLEIIRRAAVIGAMQDYDHVEGIEVGADYDEEES